MMKIKAIVLDVDGTLLNREKKISSRTKEILLKAQQQGILLVLASGRPTKGLIEFGKELRMDDYNGFFVSFNGSKVVEAKTLQERFNAPMTKEQGRAVLEHLKKFKVIPMIDKEDYMIVNNVFDGILKIEEKEVNIIEHESRGNKYKLCEKADLAAFVDYPLNKILTAGEPEYLKEHYTAMMEPFKDTLNCMFTSPFYFEFTAKGIDKAKALDAVLKPMGVSGNEMISFGDAQNDVSIIKHAKIGVAMGNAVDELKEIADEITTTCDEDGIVLSLLKHIPGLS